LIYSKRSIIFFFLIIAAVVQFHLMRRPSLVPVDSVRKALVCVRMQVGACYVKNKDFDLECVAVSDKCGDVDKRDLAGVCVDKERGLILLSNAYFDLFKCGSVNVILHDGQECLARLVFQDSDFCLAVVQLEHVPETLGEVAVEPSMCANVDGYHLLYGEEYYNCAEILPIQLPYQFASWRGCDGGRGSIFIHPVKRTLVGLSIWERKDQHYFLGCPHIYHILKMLRDQSSPVLYRTMYDFRIIPTDLIMQWGHYSCDIDQQLSATKGEETARYVCVVTRGDGVLQEGDIMKYYHVDVQMVAGQERVIWGGPNGRSVSNGTIKVLRQGRVIDLHPSACPVQRKNVFCGAMTFWQPGFFFRHLLGWVTRAGCFCREMSAQQVGRLGMYEEEPWRCCAFCTLEDSRRRTAANIVRRVNGKEFATVGELENLLGVRGAVIECGEPGQTQCLMAVLPTSRGGD